ncbi:methyltransferase domain-containing protein [Paenibacillus thailandensis]|uniref:Methyltransferase domain-containing protein n=1 Tax=Paenibacillus thailandensis TaxID=393250 RepID=A0ABW5QSE7_9BACL
MEVERIETKSKDYVELLFHWHRYLIAQEFVTGKVVLDIACGEGYGAYQLSKQAKEVIGMDIDPKTIEIAKNSYVNQNLRFLCGDAKKIEIPNNSIDIIVSFETIEHMNENDQIEFLNEIKRILKPDGILLISTPDKTRTDLFEAKNPFHLREWYKEEFEAILQTLFTNVRIYLQEVNMSSFLWESNNSIDKLLMNKKIKISGEHIDSAPSEEIKNHLYMLAVCSNNEITENIASICHEVNRTPLENLWNRYSEDVAEYQEKIKVLERDKILYLDKLNEYEQELSKLRAEYDGLVNEVEKKKEDVKRFQSQIEFLMEDKERLKKRISYISEHTSTYKDVINSQIKEKEQLWHLLNTVRQEKAIYENQLNEIFAMKSWKLVGIYRAFMDKTLMGRILKKIKNGVFILIGNKGRV